MAGVQGTRQARASGTPSRPIPWRGSRQATSRRTSGHLAGQAVAARHPSSSSSVPLQSIGFELSTVYQSPAVYASGQLGAATGEPPVPGRSPRLHPHADGAAVDEVSSSTDPGPASRLPGRCAGRASRLEDSQVTQRRTQAALEPLKRNRLPQSINRLTLSDGRQEGVATRPSGTPNRTKCRVETPFRIRMSLRLLCSGRQVKLRWSAPISQRIEHGLRIRQRPRFHHGCGSQQHATFPTQLAFFMHTPAVSGAPLWKPGPLTSSTGVRVHKHDMERLATVTGFPCDRIHGSTLPAEAQAGTLRHVDGRLADLQDGRFDDARDENFEVGIVRSPFAE